MPHGIQSYYQNRFVTTAPLQPRANVRASAEAPQPASPASASRSMAGPTQPGLSAAEQQMIDRYFPSSETMALRIYGPGQGARTLTPANLGSRLDLQG